jgi:hypothetical protein
VFHAEVDDTAGYVEVPVDDYRSVRRAILDLTEFETAEPQLVIDRLVRERTPQAG